MKNAKSETKVTVKESKGELLKFLEAVHGDVTENLGGRIKYTLDKALENINSVTKMDLVDLVNEAKEDLNSKITVENAVKPKIVEEDESEDEDAMVSNTEKVETPKKSAKKKPVLKKKVEETTPVSKKSFAMAKFFPETIEHEDLGTLKAVPDKYTSYKELYTALDSGKTLYFACYWSARQIKEFDYNGSRLVSAPKKFPHDLDLLVAVVPCEKIERVWCMSQYTEAMFMFEGENLEPVADKDLTTGEDFKIRVNNGMEFEIYEPVED